MRSLRERSILLCPLLCIGTALAGCNTLEGQVAAGATAVTLAGARTPGQELEQTYYLGIFDPTEQLPPAVYRVRVRGQASIISSMKYGSGWVHASLIDSLGTEFSFKDSLSEMSLTKTDGIPDEKINTGRRQIIFGPEGFREAPKDHRLVIVMGSSPEKYFQAMDESLRVVGTAINDRRHEGLNKRLLDALTRAKAERDKLDALAAASNATFAE